MKPEREGKASTVLQPGLVAGIALSWVAFAFYGLPHAVLVQEGAYWAVAGVSTAVLGLLSSTKFGKALGWLLILPACALVIVDFVAPMREAVVARWHVSRPSSSYPKPVAYVGYTSLTSTIGQALAVPEFSLHPPDYVLLIEDGPAIDTTGREGKPEVLTFGSLAEALAFLKLKSKDGATILAQAEMFRRIRAHGWMAGNVALVAASARANENRTPNRAFETTLREAIRNSTPLLRGR